MARKPRKGSKTTWTGMRVYYRRALRNGSVILYLRDATRRTAGRLTVDPEAAKAFKPGKSYTVEQTWA